MFSIKKRKNGGRILCLFGKKILSFGTHSNRLILEDLRSVVSMLYAGLSAEALPSAVGFLRDIQLGDLKILKEIDRVCKECGLTYWIDFGTLLGAVRHKGFIPWDDDIDICMPREDYQNFIKLFNQSCHDERLKAELYSHESGKYNSIKVVHKDIQSICVDVFPVDFCYQEMDDDEKLKFSAEIKSLTLKHAKKARMFSSTADFHDSFRRLSLECFESKTGDKKTKSPTVFYGVEFHHHSHPYNAFDYDTIFPLRKIVFEGLEFPCVAKPDLYLAYIFGDYLKLPKKIHAHVDVSSVALEEVLRTKKYIKRGGGYKCGRTVITYGTFDVLHYGHINLLKRAKALGDYLIVAVSTDEFNNIKNKQSFYTYEQRKLFLEACRYVDLIIPENNWEQKIDDVKKYHVDVFVMGDDWKGKFDFLKDLCEVVYLPRTPGVCSTNTKSYLAKK